jgi:hypothetical protein
MGPLEAVAKQAVRSSGECRVMGQGPGETAEWDFKLVTHCDTHLHHSRSQRRHTHAQASNSTQPRTLVGAADVANRGAVRAGGAVPKALTPAAACTPWVRDRHHNLNTDNSRRAEPKQGKEGCQTLLTDAPMKCRDHRLALPCHYGCLALPFGSSTAGVTCRAAGGRGHGGGVGNRRFKPALTFRRLHSG